MECLGCRIVQRMEPSVNVVFEDEDVVCVLDIAPFNDGHLLILPRKHYLDVEEMDEKTLTSIMRTYRNMSQVLKSAFNPDGITICQNGGVFNDLTHYHMHLIPRYRGDGFGWKEPNLDNRGRNKWKITLNEASEILKRQLK